MVRAAGACPAGPSHASPGRRSGRGWALPLRNGRRPMICAATPGTAPHRDPQSPGREQASPCECLASPDPPRGGGGGMMLPPISHDKVPPLYISQTFLGLFSGLGKLSSPSCELHALPVVLTSRQPTPHARHTGGACLFRNGGCLLLMGPTTSKGPRVGWWF